MNWWNRPRVIMTFGTLCKLNRRALWLALIAWVVLYVSGTGVVSSRIGQHVSSMISGCCFTLTMFCALIWAVTSVWRNAVEMKAMTVDTDRRMLALLQRVDMLVEHAKNTGFDFDTLPGDHDEASH